MKSLRSYKDELINHGLREHTASASDWVHKDVARILHEWAERFALEFKLELPVPAINIERLPIRLMGQYRHGRNGLGIAHEISLNQRYLSRPLVEQLETLLHELLHLWQSRYGRSGRSNYHNIAYRRKAALYGLIVNEKGEHTGIVPGLFTELLTKEGVDLGALQLADADPFPKPRPRGQSKLRKWSCGCTNVRCAVDLLASCRKCGGIFEEAPPAW